jgi:hypothetical protein
MVQLTTSLTADSTTLPEMAAITERIRGEFREMPGLTLTAAQARRLWNLDAYTCGEVLAQLIDTGFLCHKADGAYGRASDLSAHPLGTNKAGFEFIDIDPPSRSAAER